jgi:hypothetical protein
MSRQSIPDEIKLQARLIVERFNQGTIKDPEHFYRIRFGGVYLYLDRTYFGAPSPICRLKYKGGLDNWDFAIYRYSKERYDPEEWMFPGVDHVDGTIEGAMKAGLQAYPTSDQGGMSLLKSVIRMFFGRGE